MRQLFDKQGNSKEWQNALVGHRIKYGGAEELIIKREGSRIESICCPVIGIILRHSYNITPKNSYKFLEIFPEVLTEEDEAFEKYKKELEGENLYKNLK